MAASLGRFQLRGKVGAGAFGVVYRAYDPALEREVALKVPHPGTLSTRRRRRRFLDDARAAAGLHHPNIVPVFEVGQDGDRCYIASAFLEGGTLQAAMGPGLPLRRGVAIVRDLARALAYAHDQGVVHRDVKPANVVLDGQGRPHLIDFGLATRPEALDTADDPSVTGTRVGTPAFMAPEAARGGARPTPALDQYSLGVTLYEVLTGQLPFEGPAEVVIYNVMNTTPPPPRAVRPGLPRDLDAVCRKAMARDPAVRYRTCHELADDLDNWLGGRPVAARPPGPLERLGRGARAAPLLTATLIVTAGLLVMLAVVMTVSAARMSEQARQQKSLAEQAEAARGAEEQQRGIAEAALQRARDEADRAGKALNDKVEALRKETEALAEAEAQRGITSEALTRLREVLREEQRKLYFSLVDRAARELRDGQPDRARAHLDGCPEPLGWEWRHLRAECDRDSRAARRPLPVALNAAGSRLAWVTPGGEVLLRPTSYAATKKLRQMRPAGRPTGLTFAPDSGWLYVSCANGVIEAWAVEGDAAKPAASLHLKGEPRSVAISAGRPQIAVSAGREVHLLEWGPSGGLRVARRVAIAAEVTAAQFTPAGEELVITTPTAVVLHDLSGKTAETRFESFTAATVHVHLGRAKAPQVFQLGAKQGGRVVVLDGKNRELCQFTGHQADVIEVRASQPEAPSKVQVATLDETGVLRLWDVHPRGDAHEPQERFSTLTTAFALSANGRTLAWRGRDGTIRLKSPRDRFTEELSYDALTGREPVARGAEAELERYTEYIHALAIDDAGKHLITASSVPGTAGRRSDQLLAGEVVVWDRDTGRAVARSRADQSTYAVVCAGNGQMTWGGRGGGLTFARLPLRDEQRARTRADLGDVYCLAINPTGERLLVGGSRGRVEVWDAVKRVPAAVLRASGPAVFAAAWSPDGKALAVADAEGGVSVWDGGLKPLWAETRTHDPAGRVLSFSPDGARLASGGEDGVIRLWDARTGKAGFSLRAHTGPVIALDFSPNQQDRLASSGRDRTIRLWEPETGREALVLPLSGTPTGGLCWRPREGDELFAGTVQGVRRWHAPRQADAK